MSRVHRVLQQAAAAARRYRETRPLDQLAGSAARAAPLYAAVTSHTCDSDQPQNKKGRKSEEGMRVIGRRPGAVKAVKFGRRSGRLCYFVTAAYLPNSTPSTQSVNIL